MTTSPSARGTPSGSGSRPSIGNESTSVASSMPRWSRFSVRISSTPTNASPSSPSSMPSARSTAPACSTAAPSSTATPLRLSTSTESTALLAPCAAGLLRMLAIRLHDPLHELVPDDVLEAEADERDVVDALEDVLHLDQPRRLVARQVDLRDVAGDDDLRAEAEPRQEHLHLLGRGVLRLVEDDEAVVERAAAHERERRHLDRAALHVGVRALRVEHVVERVEQGAQVRIALGHHVAGQEPEPLARLDRGPREDD